MKIVELQQRISSHLEKQIRLCLRSDAQTHVVELYLPTGWGKTRAVSQALLKVGRKTRNMRLTLMIFPRNGVLLRPWRNCVAWCGHRQLTIQACREARQEFRPVVPMPRVERKRVPPRELQLVCMKENNSGEARIENIPIRALQGNRTGWKFVLSKRQDDPRSPLGTRGPVVIVIDEFHRRNLYSVYQKNVIDVGGYANLYDYFVDHLGLSRSHRKVVFMLVSATPINPVNEREMLVCPDDIGYPVSEKEYGVELQQEIVRWRTVIASLSGRLRACDADKPFVTMLHKGKTAKDISSIWSSAQHRLLAASRETAEDAERLRKSFTNAKWLDDYHTFARNAYYPPADMSLYVVENLWLGGVRDLKHVSGESYGRSTRQIIKRLHEAEETRKRESPKLKTLMDFLELRATANRRFVVFCIYQATASMLKEELCKQGIPANWARGNNPNSLIDTFNDRTSSLRVLIATDSLAEGFDLHKARQHLIHYELSWSPLRMIQRFGRAWRIMEPTGSLTAPVAYHIPFPYSSDEEVLNRLRRRWEILENKTNLHFPSWKIVLGHRLSPYSE
jgi:hypothetical protein